MSGAPSLILTRGRVWRGLAEGFAEAVACADGRVVATGASAEIEALRGPETRVVDLGGRLATPGLNDAHMHLLPYGLAMDEVDLRPSRVATLEAFLAAVAERAAATPKGEWILGRGYDHFRLDVGRHPRIEELDRVAPDHPVYLVRTDGHLAVVNSLALERAGIGPDTPSPEGGLIEREDGRFTGLIAETARELFVHAIPRTSEAAMVAALEKGGRDLLTYGITSVMEAAVGMRDGWAEMLAYRRAHAEGRLPVRVWATIMHDPGRTIFAEATEAGLVSGMGDERFTVGGVKIFTDGSAGGRTAAMSRPYLGRGPDDLGILCMSDEEVRARVLEAHRGGWRMAVHAIGDRAIEQTLSAFEMALDAMPDLGRRHRIEHCGWLTPDQLARMTARAVLPVPQPVFLRDFGDLYLDILEPERVEASHPMRDWIEAGLQPSASTDCPVCEIDPFANLHAMVARETRSGRPLGERHRLSMGEALHAYTYASAYAAKQEGEKGRLVPGQLADIAVFDRDLFEVAPAEIPQTRCDLTVLGGEVVHERAGAA